MQEAKQRRLPAGHGRKLRPHQLPSISKPWSSCSQSQPQPCYRQLPHTQQPGGSMPLHAGSCWALQAPASTSRMPQAGMLLQILSRCSPA